MQTNTAPVSLSASSASVAEPLDFDDLFKGPRADKTRLLAEGTNAKEYAQRAIFVAVRCGFKPAQVGNVPVGFFSAWLVTHASDVQLAALLGEARAFLDSICLNRYGGRYRIEEKDGGAHYYGRSCFMYLHKATPALPAPVVTIEEQLREAQARVAELEEALKQRDFFIQSMSDSIDQTERFFERVCTQLEEAGIEPRYADALFS